MTVLVYGGSASGKSALAEEVAQRLGGPLWYVATMRPGGAEGLSRIQRHREARAGKGFCTVERYLDLESLELADQKLECQGLNCQRLNCLGLNCLGQDGPGTALLECLGNLAANELFDRGAPPGEVAEALRRGLSALSRQCRNLVVVSNDIFSGAEQYTGEMKTYLEVLGKVNRMVAAEADVVIESVCGLALFGKGRELLG